MNNSKVALELKDLLVFSDQKDSGTLKHFLVDKDIIGCTNGSAILYQPTENTNESYILDSKTGEKNTENAIRIKQLVGVGYDFSFKINRFDLEKACKALELLSDPSRKVIEFELKDRQLILRTKNFTECELKLEIGKDVPNFLTGFCVEYIINYLKLINKRFKHSLTETITIDLCTYPDHKDPRIKSTNIKPIELGYGDIKCLIMPICLKRH